MGFFSSKPKGWIPSSRISAVQSEISRAANRSSMLHGTQIGGTLGLPPIPLDEDGRQVMLMAYASVVEAAVDDCLPEDLNMRTERLLAIVEDMRKYRLTLLDRNVLTSIGNLLIDSDVRKGRSIDDQIPRDELDRMRGRIAEYQRWCGGRL